MPDNDKEKQTDRLLDSMLSQYSAVEPRPGLETRVLAQIAESRERRPGRLRWLVAGTGIAASAIAVVVVMLVLRVEQRHSPTLPQADSIQAQQQRRNSAAGQVAPTIRTARRRVAVRHAVTAQKAEKKNRQFQSLAVSQRPAIFPTPAPLTEQERLMFSYVENTPRGEVVAQVRNDDQKEARAFWAEGEPLLRGKAQ